LNSRPLPYQGSALPLSYISNYLILSGRRDSNSRPLAWKANALSTELLPQIMFRSFGFGVGKLETLNMKHFCGESRIRTYEDVRHLSYSQTQLATLVSPHHFFQELFLYEPNLRFELRTPRLQITCSGQLS
jgi:hypothetical protein